jgi:hypothetical protein
MQLETAVLAEGIMNWTLTCLPAVIRNKTGRPRD